MATIDGNMCNDAASKAKIKPRIIIHGGAGNITKTSLSREMYNIHLESLNAILEAASNMLDKPGQTALDVATYAVSLLEDDPLYNSAHGAVFTREGKNELECSIMVSQGYQKRSVGCMLLSHVKNPIKLARELLMRGELENGGGGQDHCAYSGEYVEKLAREWGLEMVNPSYYFTQKRWDQHKRGKEDEGQSHGSSSLSDWERNEYIPLGTCGAVVLDSFGTICVATSTGGLTNKLPGRIGDTPTVGAGYWVESWTTQAQQAEDVMRYQAYSSSRSTIDSISRGDLQSLLGDCMPSLYEQPHSGSQSFTDHKTHIRPKTVRHSVGLSGTGNGDSFLRLCAARTAAAYSRFSPTSLSKATSWMAGIGGELQESAGEQWKHGHVGIGGMIGIELVDNEAEVVFDYNCGGLFRAWTERDGTRKALVFREDDWESGPERWEGT